MHSAGRWGDVIISAPDHDARADLQMFSFLAEKPMSQKTLPLDFVILSFMALLPVG